ncbi:MAG: hydrolase 1, exosortase A system-associated, partial [Burkholderiales bacterium]|nr:hydrolase 1, exosortase A system-associated [Burkholderiales bacterium]
MSAPHVRELAATFACGGERMVGIVSLPQQPSRRGVLVVVGGPQYRAGSHRQFTLLCRGFAANGIAAMRFDYRGMGDAEGDSRTFEDIDGDIRAAIDHFCAQVPELSEVVLCGLCDAASAALFYAHADPRVRGMVLINPWARTAAGIAKTHLRHYYAGRIADREFWRRLVRGEVATGAALRSAAGALRAALGFPAREPATLSLAPAGRHAPAPAPTAPLPERMADGLARFGGPVLLVRSGRDLTAQEFSDIADASPQWRGLLGAARVTLRDLPDA